MSDPSMHMNFCLDLILLVIESHLLMCTCHLDEVLSGRITNVALRKEAEKILFLLNVMWIYMDQDHSNGWLCKWTE